MRSKFTKLFHKLLVGLPLYIVSKFICILELLHNNHNKILSPKYLKFVLPLFLGFLLLFFSSWAIAEVPNVMNFQAKLTDPSNVLLTDTYNFTFRIFKTATGGSNLWNEQQRLRVDQGIVNAILGNNTALNLSFNETYYLEIQIGSETLTPRHRIATNGYAFRANTSEDLVCTSCVESNDIASNAVTSAKIASGAVTSSKLAADLTLEGNLNAASGLFYLDNTTRRVGINDTTPDGIFDIDVSGAANLLVVNVTTGNTGFGTASPVATLDIRGDVNATGLLNISRIVIWGASANLTEWRNAAGTPIASINSTGGAELRGGLRLTTLTSCDTIDTDASGNFRCGSDAGGTGSTGWSVSGQLVYNDTTGINVSIGTQTVPAGYILAVAGSINITGNINGTFVGTLAANTVTTTSIADNAVTTSKIANAAVTSAKLAADLTLEGNLNAGSGMLFIDNATRRVGINDTSPDGIFDVDVSGAVDALFVSSTGGQGYVGIGTASPSTRLHVFVNDTTSSAVTNLITLDHVTTVASNGSAGISVGMLFRAEDAVGATENIAQIAANLTTATNTSESGAITFFTRTAGGALTERVRIDDAGNVGIGTTSPITTLDVRGNINATGFGNFTTLQLVTGGTLLFPNNIITSAMIQSVDQAKLSITIPFTNVTSRNGTLLTDVVQSIDVDGRIWGNVTLAGGNDITLSRSGQTITIAVVGNSVLANESNTFTTAQYFNLVNISVLLNVTTVNITSSATILGNLTIASTNLNASNLVIRNVLPSPNTTQERWLDTNGRVVAMRYWNGTALVLNVTG